MRSIIFVVSLLLVSCPCVLGTLGADQQQPQSATPVLQVTVVPKQQEYRLSDYLQGWAMVENLRYEDIYILNAMWFGHFGSFTLHVLDSSGTEIRPAGPSHAPILVTLPVDETQLVRLQYAHFLGSRLSTPLEFLNIRRPGRYGIFVEYESPIRDSDVSVKPFWGREKGPIKSAVVWIQVRR